MNRERLRKQIEFIVEVDKLKQICRKNFIIGGARNETDAEHSWHLAMMAMLLSEHVTDQKIDVLRVLKMVLVHDLVEIDAGDTYCFDENACQDQHAREQRAAKRIFHLLPEDQASDFHHLWEEFEERQTPDARFAAALDRLQPLLLHYHTEGKSWRMNGITSEKVYKRNEHTREISVSLGKFVDEVIEDAITKGYLTR